MVDVKNWPGRHANSERPHFVSLANRGLLSRPQHTILAYLFRFVKRQEVRVADRFGQYPVWAFFVPNPLFQVPRPSES